MLYIKLIVWLYPFIKEIFDNDKNLIFKFKKALYNSIFIGILIVSVVGNFYLVDSLFTVSSNYRDLSEKTKDYTTIKSKVESFKRINNELEYQLKNIKQDPPINQEQNSSTQLNKCVYKKRTTRRHTIHAISDHNY